MPFLYNGKEYSDAEVQAAAQQSNLSVDDYVSRIGLEPKVDNQVEEGKEQPQVPGAPVEATVAPDMESKLEDTSLGSYEQKKADKERQEGIEKLKEDSKIIQAASDLGLGDNSIVNIARAGAFVARTAAGLADYASTFAGIALDYENPLAGPLNLISFLVSSDERRKQKVEEVREKYDFDMSGLYEAADAIDNLKPKYFDKDGNEQDIFALALEEKDFGKAAEVAISDAIASAPSLAISMAFPLAGSAALGMSTMGQTFEKELKERPDATMKQLYQSAYAKGIFEFGTEYAAGKLGRYFAGLKGANAPTDALRTVAERTITGVLKSFGGGFAAEGATEAATTIGQEWTDHIVYGDEKNWGGVLRQSFNSFVVGGLLGGPVSATGKTITMTQTKLNRQNVYEHAAPIGVRNKIANLNTELASIRTQKELAEDFEQDFLQELENEKKAEIKEQKQRIYDKFESLTRTELKQYADNLDKAGRYTYEATKATGNKQIIDAAKAKAKAAFEANDKIFGDTDFYNVKVETSLTEQLKGIEYQTEVYKRDRGYLPSDFTMKQMSNEEIVAEYGESESGKDGFFDGSILVVNSSIGLNPNVVGHEVLHAVMSRQFKTDNKSMEPLVNALKDYLNQSEEGKKILQRMDERIAAHYTDKDGNIKKGSLEEYLNVFSDIYKNEGIEYDDTAAEKLRKKVNTTLKSLRGVDNVVELNTGEDVFNFLKDFSQNINSKNPFLIKAAMNVKIKSDLLTEKPVSEEEVAAEEKVIKDSISAKDKQDMMDLYNKRMEGVERTEYTKNKPLPPRLENELVGKFYGYINTLVNKKFMQLQEEAIEKEDAVAILMGEALNAIRTFNPAKNDDISGYVASILARRQSMIFADVSKEFTDDVETSKEAQSFTEEITQTEEEVKKEAIKETLLEAIDVKRTVEGKTYEEHVIDAVAKNARLAIRAYGEEVSANRTVTPFVAKVKEGLAEDLRQITKKFINEYGYEAFLKDHKKAILKNFTTTYLSRHPLFRKGIEKSIGGKMTTDNQGNPRFEPNYKLPAETSANKYEWVDDSGKKAKIDRDNAGARGLTSGPEIMRRSPKIDSIISDNEFIDYHFADGALRQKKKQNPEDALARQIASELGFDLLKQDLTNNGEIAQQLQEVGELYELVLAEAEMSKIAKDIDRGTIKYSKSTNPYVSAVIKLGATESAAFEILNDSIYNLAKKDPELVEELALVITFGEQDSKLFNEFLLPGLADAVDNAKSEEEKINLIKEFLNLYSRPARAASKRNKFDLNYTTNRRLLNVIRDSLKSKKDKELIGTRVNSIAPIKLKKMGGGGFGVAVNGVIVNYDVPHDITSNVVAQKIVDGKIPKKDVLAQNLVARARLEKILFETSEDPRIVMPIIKLMQKDQRSVLRQAAPINAIVQNYTGEVRYEHNPPTQYIYKLIEAYVNNRIQENKDELLYHLDRWEANIVPKDFADIVDKDYQTTIPLDGTDRYDKAKAQTNYKFDVQNFGETRFPGKQDLIDGKKDFNEFKKLGEMEDVYFHGTDAKLNESFLKEDLIREELIGADKGLYSDMIGFPKFFTKNVDYAESYIDRRVREDGTGTVAAVHIVPTKAKEFKGGPEKILVDIDKTVGQDFENKLERNKAYIKELRSQGFDAIVLKEGPRSAPNFKPAKVIVSLDPKNRVLAATIDTKSRNMGAVPGSYKTKNSISSKDAIRLNDMISETGKITKGEIGEATATRMGKNKGRFSFYIPPSADDFAGMMYYMLRRGELGEQDMQFIKEKLLDPFARNHAQWESYKLRKLNEFRKFKKLLRETPSTKLSAKNEYGFTNEDAVRVWLWNQKGVENISGITAAEKYNLLQLVENNPALLKFAQNMNNLFLGRDGYPDPQENWYGTSITIDVIEHINEQGRKDFFREFSENAETLFGKLNNRGEISGPIANKLRAAYGDNYVEALSDILYRMKNGRAREFGKNRLMNQFNNWISNSVGAVMFFNTRSAILQQTSMINFINLTDNNPLKFAAAVGNQKQFWEDYMKLINSDFLVSRRNGLKIDVNQDEIAKAADSGKNPVQSVISLILKKGFLLTTWGDSNAIAMGGATFYRNRINTHMNDGLTLEEAEQKAFMEFKEIAEESQQSSRPDRISQQQASTLGRVILAWANTPMQYARLTKKAYLDLTNGRGDWKTNMSKLVYYGAIQNLMFTYMQQGLFSMIFDGEDEEEEDAKKWEFTFNSMADGFLRGLGYGGAIVSTAKNMVLEAIDQAKGRGDYDEVVWEALKLSPPLGSKIAKARAVGRTFGWKQEREKVFTEGWSLDNPAFEAIGKAVSATTNIPLDRVVRKLDNISYPMRHDIEFWQAAALYLGWGQWELGLKEVNKKEKTKGGLKQFKLKQTKVK